MKWEVSSFRGTLRNGSPSWVFKPLQWCSPQCEVNAQASTPPVPPVHSLADVTEEVQVLLVNVHSRSLTYLYCFSLLLFSIHLTFLECLFYSQHGVRHRGRFRGRKSSPWPWGSYVLHERKRMVVKCAGHNQPLHEDGPDNMAASHLRVRTKTSVSLRALRARCGQPRKTLL